MIKNVLFFPWVLRMELTCGVYVSWNTVCGSGLASNSEISLPVFLANTGTDGLCCLTQPAGYDPYVFSNKEFLPAFITVLNSHGHNQKVA